MKKNTLGRTRCFLGLHDVRPDPQFPHIYWCARPLCKWIDGGHP